MLVKRKKRNKEPKITTTIRLPQSMLKKVKMRAVQEDVFVSVVVERAVNWFFATERLGG